MMCVTCFDQSKYSTTSSCSSSVSTHEASLHAKFYYIDLYMTLLGFRRRSLNLL